MSPSRSSSSAPNRLAIVTGTSRGIGAAVARQLLDQGWEVVGIARHPGAIEQPAYHHITLDLGDLSTVTSAIVSQLGPWLEQPRWQRIGLVNNAATIGPLGPLERVEPAALLELYGLNTVAPIALMGALIRHTRIEAALRIVNVSSGAAVRVTLGLGAYGSSKAALRLAGMALGAELEAGTPGTSKRSNVAILSYEPGVVDTEMQVSARSRSTGEFPWVDRFLGFWREGRLVPPETPAAEIVAFLEGDGPVGFSERRLGGERPS